MQLKINRLQHIGIPVNNLATSELFYQKLGFTNIMTANFDHNNNQGTVAMMQNGSIIIEIYQLPDTEISTIKNRKDGRINHIAFDVDNIEECFDAVKQLGFKPLEDYPVKLNFWSKGCMYFNISGPDGERLEFNQILKY